MPTHVVNALDSFSDEQIEKLGASRSAILEPAFDAYLVSDDLREMPPPPPSIQLLPASDLCVKLTRGDDEISISRISDPDADNFMGYSAEENCIVFKGETGLFDRFVEFAESITQDKDVTVMLKTASQVRIPRQGLEYGLSYEMFAARVELLECAMWVRGPRPKGQGRNSCQLDASPKINRPSTPPQQLAIGGPLTSNAIDPHGRNVECKSPSSDSSSSLSPPPEIITTPPSFKHLKRDSPRNEDTEISSGGADKARAGARRIRIMARGSTKQ